MTVTVIIIIAVWLKISIRDSHGEMVDMTHRLGNDTTIYPAVSRKMEIKIMHRGWVRPNVW